MHLNKLHLNKKRSLETLSLICWAVAVFAYFFQFPFPFLSFLIVPCIAGYMLLQFPNFYLPKNKKYLVLFMLFILYVGFSVIRALILGNSINKIFRFSAITLLLPVSCLVQDSKFSVKWKLFLNFAMLKALILIGIMVWLLIKGDYTELRGWAYRNNLGDIYLLSRWNPKVQVHGNSLLVVAFITDFMQKKRLSLYNTILLVGVLAAGNFAYILGLGLFLGWRGCLWGHKLLKAGKISKKAVIAIAVCCIIIATPYLISKIQQKAAVSNKTRIEQTVVLTDTNPLIGKGFGNHIKADTSTRIYDGDIYFELQTLYIYNQIGAIGVLFVYLLTIWPVYKKGRQRAILYIIYLIFTFWNPYCWDTTHLITLLLLINTKRLGVTNETGDYYNVLSIYRSEIKHFRNLRTSR